MTPTQFAKIGEALYGPSWRTALADALKVGERTVRRWEKGDSPIPDGLIADLAALCLAQAEALKKIAERLEGVKS